MWTGGGMWGPQGGKSERHICSIFFGNRDTSINFVLKMEREKD